MKQEEYQTLKTILKNEEELLEYEILKHIQENIFTDQYTFQKMYNELNKIAQKHETKKIYEFMKYHEYENIKPCNRNNKLREIKTEFNDYIINSTKNYKIIKTG